MMTHFNKLPTKKFMGLLDLYIKQPWLERLTQELYDLLDICSNMDEQILLLELLARFQYVEGDQITHYLDSMVRTIIDTWRLPDTLTQIACVAVGNDPDSSQLVAQILKNEFVKRKWTSVKIITRIGDSVKLLKKCPHVVLIDEFVGTGITMAKRIRDIRRYYDHEITKGKVDKYTIRVCVIASMSDAHSIITDLGVDMFAAVWLKKGISGYLSGDEYTEACNYMHRLESELAQNINGSDLPSFGSGGAEALYCMENSNPPNSVFPVFWWPKLVDGSSRRTLLTRWEPQLI